MGRKRIVRQIQFDPSKVKYKLRMKRATKRGGKEYRDGPYWFAHTTIDGKTKSWYIGRELPEECIPYCPDYEQAIIRFKGMPVPKTSMDEIKEALDFGDQVILDIQAIAKSCDAYVDSLSMNRFLFYRDPKWVTK